MITKPSLRYIFERLKFPPFVLNLRLADSEWSEAQDTNLIIRYLLLENLLSLSAATTATEVSVIYSKILGDIPCPRCFLSLKLTFFKKKRSTPLLSELV